MFHNYGEIEALHQKLSSEKLPETLPKLRQRGLLSYSEEAGAWVYPFVGPDKSIMGRTERARHLLDGERPAQVWKSMIPCGKSAESLIHWRSFSTCSLSTFHRLVHIFCWNQ